MTGIGREAEHAWARTRPRDRDAEVGALRMVASAVSDLVPISTQSTPPGMDSGRGNRNNRNGRTLMVDGIYGPKTQAAVRALQQGAVCDIHGFPVDGIVGPLTWQALVTEPSPPEQARPHHE